jgi:hypothetical protein
MAIKKGCLGVFYDLTIRMPKVATAVVEKVLARARTELLHKETQVDIPHSRVEPEWHSV